MGKRLAIAILAGSIAILPPVLVLGQEEDCEIQMVLVGESVQSGDFTRVFHVVNDCGTGLRVSRRSISGLSAETTLEAKLELIERGLGVELRLPRGATVSDEMLRRWQEEGYRPEWEFTAPGEAPPGVDPAAVDVGVPPTSVPTPELPEPVLTPIATEAEAEEPSPGPSRWADPTSAIALTEERAAEMGLAELEGGENTPIASATTWWQRLLYWLRELWRAVTGWLGNLVGKGEG